MNSNTTIVEIKGLNMLKYLDRKVGLYREFIKEAEKKERDDLKFHIIIAPIDIATTDKGKWRIHIGEKIETDKETKESTKRLRSLGYEVLYYPTASKKIIERINEAIKKNAIVGFTHSFFVPDVKIWRTYRGYTENI